MRIFTVHEPPARNDGESDPARFVFVRDGFYFWAFLFGPLWLLLRGLWLVLLLYVVLMVGLQVGLAALGISAAVKWTVGTLIALLVGFEASTLRRWTYGRRGWRQLGVVAAPDLEAAERRFFDGYVARVPVPPVPMVPPAVPLPPAAPALRAPPPAASDVLGLFPEPEPRPRS